MAYCNGLDGFSFLYWEVGLIATKPSRTIRHAAFEQA